VSNENAVRNLIRIDDKQNPTLFRALQLLIDDLYKINEEVFPTISPSDLEQAGAGSKPGIPENFVGIAYPDNLRLQWDDLPGAFRYVIKLGTNWDTARPVITTGSNVVNLDPMHLSFVYGTYTFLLRAMNSAGELGDPAIAILVIPLIPPPNLGLEVVVSTVLLRWTVPPSAWRIDHYIVYKNNAPIGAIYGTFKLIQEQSGGTYSYSVEAVDIVGNVSARSPIRTADLHDPSEFEFVDSLEADYTGDYVRTAKTRVNGVVGIIGPVHIKTWTEHYEFFNFDSPKHQHDSGYPFYYQPSYIGDGTYEEVFDFGTIYKNLTVVVDYNKLQLVGNTDINTTIWYSEDGITWSEPVYGISVLGLSFRYIKVLWTFTNAEDLSVAFISNLEVILNVTLTIDSGNDECFAADAGGTEIFYNKTFTGMNCVTATPAISLQPLYAVTDNVTKDSFFVLVFDSSGNRVDSPVNWKARGVV